MNIKGKNIILTGASSGIGQELLSKLSKFDDVRIVAVARCVDNIKPISNKVYPFSADLSNKDGVDSLFKYALEKVGKIDVFIANAGFAYLEKLKDANWEHIESIFTLNVFSPIYSLEKLAEQTETNPILFVSTISGAGLVSLPAYSLYCSTKAALHHFMQTYSFEKNNNIKLMNVYPVATRTDFFDKAAQSDDTPLPWPIQNTESVANAIIKGILRNEKTVYPSLVFRMFYPIGRAFPFMLKIYSSIEKKKVRKWLKT